MICGDGLLEISRDAVWRTLEKTSGDIKIRVKGRVPGGGAPEVSTLLLGREVNCICIRT